MVVLFKMLTKSIFVFIVSSLTAIVDAKNFRTPRDQEANSCLLPPYPEHGKYTVNNYPSARPGESYPSVKLDVSCDTGYQIENNTNSIFCVNGYWSATMPTCPSFCTLTDDLSVEYRCELSGPGSLKYSQECESMVPSGTVVTPICRSPGYFSLEVLDKMHCRDGIWDYKPICKRACGTITQHRQLEGTSNYHVELPWHAVIYRNESTSCSDSFIQICAGSLISSNTVITTARCFLDVKLKIMPASYFLVAVGKLYVTYNDPRDRNSQQSNVVDIKISSDYGSTPQEYIHKIALVTVERPFIFHLSVRPVCLDFDFNLDRTQLREGTSGKAAGWSKADKYSQLPQVLKAVELSIMNSKDCNDMASINLHFDPAYYGGFCGEYTNNTSVCETDIGGGLAFLESTTQRYYLRGVLTANSREEEFYLPFQKNDMCYDPFIYMSFNTYISIKENEDFINQHL